MNKVLSEFSFWPPALVIIQYEATQEQKDAVIAGKAYHVIRDVDNQRNNVYLLRFAKKNKKEITATGRSSKDSKKPEFTYSYETAPLDEASVFYHVATQTPKRLTSMADTSAPRDTYGFYFLEEVIRKAGGFVDFLQDRIRLGGVYKDLREWMNPSNDESYSLKFENTIRQAQLRLAMQHLLFGNQKMVEKLVKADPSLLFEKNTLPVKDISGKSVVEKTLLQAAFCAGDVANHPGEICMAEMLKGYLEKLSSDREEMQTQVAKIFPEGFPEDKKEDPPHIVAQKEKAERFGKGTLNPLIEAIRAATNNEIQEMDTNKRAETLLGQAFASFREKIEPLSVEDEVFNRVCKLICVNRHSQVS